MVGTVDLSTDAVVEDGGVLMGVLFGEEKKSNNYMIRGEYDLVVEHRDSNGKETRRKSHKTFTRNVVAESKEEASKRASDSVKKIKQYGWGERGYIHSVAENVAINKIFVEI